MTRIVTSAEAEPRLDWIALTEALAAGHQLPRAQIGDTFLGRAPDTLLSRAAWIDGLGALVKTATIFPGNGALGLSAVNGGVCLYSDRDGTLEALLDFHLVTKWKTAGDSLLAALRLAPPKVERILILGAGTVAASMIAAYGAGFPGALITIWNRTPATAQALAARYPGTRVAPDLREAAAEADIICTATMSNDPVLQGDWLSPGTHVDMIGAYKADMREGDDALLTRARLFLDSRATVIGHIGEITIPLEAGVIADSDIIADYYDLHAFRRTDPDEITVCKNGGGAHLDLMTARHILDRVGA
jgi:ornithine cyclodeaminase